MAIKVHSSLPKPDWCATVITASLVPKSSQFTGSRPSKSFAVDMVNALTTDDPAEGVTMNPVFSFPKFKYFVAVEPSRRFSTPSKAGDELSEFSKFGSDSDTAKIGEPETRKELPEASGD